MLAKHKRLYKRSYEKTCVCERDREREEAWSGHCPPVDWSGTRGESLREKPTTHTDSSAHIQGGGIHTNTHTHALTKQMRFYRHCALTQLAAKDIL